MKNTSLSYTFTDDPLPGKGGGMVGFVMRKGVDNLNWFAHAFMTVKDGVDTHLWDVAGLDFEGRDVVLLYAAQAPAPFNTSGDMLRVSLNRRWNFGWNVGSPEHNTATYSFLVNPDTPTGFDIRPSVKGAFDLLNLYKSGDADRSWICFNQGNGATNIRTGYIGAGTPEDPYSLGFFANGASPDKPGKLIARLTSGGDLWLAGNVKSQLL